MYYMIFLGFGITALYITVIAIVAAIIEMIEEEVVPAIIEMIEEAVDKRKKKNNSSV